MSGITITRHNLRESESEDAYTIHRNGAPIGTLVPMPNRDAFICTIGGEVMITKTAFTDKKLTQKLIDEIRLQVIKDLTHEIDQRQTQG